MRGEILSRIGQVGRFCQHANLEAAKGIDSIKPSDNEANDLNGVASQGGIGEE